MANQDALNLIESVANKLAPAAQEDFRTLMQSLAGQIDTLNTATGNTPSTSAANVPAPSAPALAVAGANGSYSWQLTPGGTAGVNSQLLHEISYSPVKGFTSGVKTLPPSAATSGVVNEPGGKYFFRARSTTNGKTWSGYSALSQSAAEAGLVSSAATSDGAAFAQTNYGTVSSTAKDGATVIEISGAGGQQTSLVASKGGAETVLPAAAVVNAAANTDQFMTYNPALGDYEANPTLADALTDSQIPIGKVTTAYPGEVVLPTVALVLSSGGVVGWTVTSGGQNLSGPVTLKIQTSTGAGATAGAQTITNGSLTAVAAGNPGANYGAGDTVLVSGGGSSTPGGGSSAGGNGGRMTNV